MLNRQEIEDALGAIAKRHQGRLTPDLVVAAARDKTSPLHAHFTWDIRKAAKERWLDQARALIKLVRVEITTTEHSYHIPKYIRDPEMPSDKQGYVSFERLQTDDELARQAVINEFARAGAALKRAQDIAHALAIKPAIDDLLERLRKTTDDFTKMPAFA